MEPLLYGELVSWYRLVDPPRDHLDEAIVFRQAFERVVAPRPETLLELGSGAGHNALHLKEHFRCTLSDVSEPMLGLSRELNPTCEHVPGDMRTLRLNRTFDAVLVHDAIAYMTSRDDLRAALTTAFVHTRPGGAAIVAPDVYRETFHDVAEPLSEDDGARSLRATMWTWDPDPADDTCAVDFAFLLREGSAVRAVHDHHVEGLFSRQTWIDLLAEVGFRTETLPRPIGEGEHDEIFLCSRSPA
jgi:trans-aconitate methyltransferase